jgi:hypothetical protein
VIFVVAGVLEHLPDGSLALLLPRAEAKQVFANKHQQPWQRVHQSQHLSREQVDKLFESRVMDPDKDWIRMQ